MSEQGDERPVYTGVCATCGGFDQPRDYSWALFKSHFATHVADASQQVIARRLAPVEALADEWEAKGMTTFTGQRLCDILRDAISEGEK